MSRLDDFDIRYNMICVDSGVSRLHTSMASINASLVSLAHRRGFIDIDYIEMTGSIATQLLHPRSKRRDRPSKASESPTGKVLIQCHLPFISNGNVYDYPLPSYCYKCNLDQRHAM